MTDAEFDATHTRLRRCYGPAERCVGGCYDHAPAPAVAKRYAELRALRGAAHAALLERDAIEGCTSPEWRAAHARSSDLYRQADAIRAQLARDPVTRYGAWRTLADIELMARGYL